ncbi:MAG TPA: glycosyltransferase family 39 protein [Gemmataceae bacterium]|nr:glycosyltransferase family 39 protein [Gemmataceae bacterium]
MEVLTNARADKDLSTNGRLQPAENNSDQPANPDRSPSTWMLLAVLLLILVVGAALRFGLWTWFAGQSLHIEDEQDYNRLACNLVLHGEFAFEPGQPTSLRPPLYPALVAGVYQLFGLENFQAVRLLQAIVSLVNVILLYHLGLTVFSRKAGLWLAGLYAFYPSLLGYNNLLLTEVLFTFLLCAFCDLLICALQHDSLPYLALSAVLLGLAALSRSVVWLFPPVLACFLLLAFRGNWRRRILASVIFLTAFAFVLAPWAYRNTRLQKTFIAVDVMGGRNFMMGNYRYTPLYRSWATIELQGEESWIHEVVQTYPATQPRTQGQIDKLAMRQALKFIASNPGLTLQRSVVKFFDFWGLERELISGGDRGFFGPIPTAVLVALALLLCGSYVLALFACIYAMVLAPPADRRIHLFLLLLIAFVCALHTLAFGHSRYHLPLMPLVLAYAATAVVHRKEIWRQRRSWSFWMASGCCAIFVAGWLWGLVVVDPARILSLLHFV